jgi:hypothetical protein
MANRFIVLFGEEDKIKIQRNLFFEKNQGMNERRYLNEKNTIATSYSLIGYDLCLQSIGGKRAKK